METSNLGSRLIVASPNPWMTKTTSDGDVARSRDLLKTFGPSRSSVTAEARMIKFCISICYAKS